MTATQPCKHKDTVNSGDTCMQGAVLSAAAHWLAPQGASTESCAMPTSSFRSQLHPPGGLTI